MTSHSTNLRPEEKEETKKDINYYVNLFLFYLVLFFIYFL
jgi:hypothetical protein